MGQESRHGITGSSAQSLNQAVIGVSWLHSHLESHVGKKLFLWSFQLLAEFISLCLHHCGPQVFAGCCLETVLSSYRPPTASGGYSQFPGLRASPTWLPTSLSSQKAPAPECQVTVLWCNLITRVTSHYLCQILLVRSKPQTPFSDPTQEEGIIQNWNMMRQESLGLTLGICISTLSEELLLSSFCKWGNKDPWPNSHD